MSQTKDVASSNSSKDIEAKTIHTKRLLNGYKGKKYLLGLKILGMEGKSSPAGNSQALEASNVYFFQSLLELGSASPACPHFLPELGHDCPASKPRKLGTPLSSYNSWPVVVHDYLTLILISNQVFADDCLLFAKATTKGVRNVLQILNMFAKAFGQHVNFS
ncbi:hypothetical protein ACFX2I_028007 [Malus domestica]